jgi:phosphoglycerate dehydrogenase-like enzyme
VGLIRAAVSEQALGPVRERAPRGVEVVALQDGVDLQTIDFLVPAPGPSSVLELLPGLTRLSVVQGLLAGTDQLVGLVPAQATLCSARGARNGPVNEWILGALLGTATGLLDRARERTWDFDRRREDVGGWTVMIVGLGSIGRMVQASLQALGATVVGVASHARQGVHGIDELLGLLPRADAVVLLAPITDSTRGLFGPAELAAMRDGAVLVNAARGALVDTDALLAETATGRLRAVLDVTEPEPLPDDHPLWTAPGVLSITPHVGGASPLGRLRAAEFAGDQLARWSAGEPLLNIVKERSR